jgi:hypothetical protein
VPEAPVYLIASERSGTNLLRRRLTDCQDQYYGPAAVHFLKHLHYREPFYGDLDKDGAFSALIGDALELCQVHFAPWDMPMTVEQVLAEYGTRKRNAVLLADFLMQRFAVSKGYASYFCKDNFLYEFALDIARDIPGASFIYLYRDPRDFALSQSKRPNVSRDVLEHARLWDYEQVKSIRATRTLAALGRRVMLLSYERLIREEGQVLDEVCQFLGVERTAAAPAVADNVRDAVHDWKNLGRATMTDNAGKFQAELGKGAIGRIEMVCAQTMSYLGYARVTDRSKPISHAETLLRYLYFNVAKVLRRKFTSTPASVRQRSKLLQRLHVNYRNPS